MTHTSYKMYLDIHTTSLFLKRGPRLANGLQASKGGLLKWQLHMPGRKEKASGWHSGLRAGESDPTKKNGVDLMCDYTWQIMVTVWQEPVAKGRLKRRTTLLDIFNLFLSIDFFCHCFQIILNLACLPNKEDDSTLLIRGYRRLGTDFLLKFSYRNRPLCVLLTQSQMLSGLRHVM